VPIPKPTNRANSTKNLFIESLQETPSEGTDGEPFVFIFGLFQLDDGVSVLGFHAAEVLVWKGELWKSRSRVGDPSWSRTTDPSRPLECDPCAYTMAAGFGMTILGKTISKT
jgi:hypothetical protein